MTRENKPRMPGTITPMETPCVNVCIVDKASGLCEGCGRSVPEIASWSRMTPAERRTIMAELPARRARVFG